MANYLTAIFSRSLNQLLLLFGGIIVFAFLLCHVAGWIRGAGESLLGRGYYYLVAPGVVCHESGHAIGCLITGTEVERFEPFSPHGNTLGYVQYRYPQDECLISSIRHLVIGTGPIWFGCVLIWLCTKFLARTVFLPKFSDEFVFDQYPASKRYWMVVLRTSLRMAWNTVKVWHWRSTLNVIYLYLVFCIASEMTLSWEDVSGAWMGFVALVALFVLLNVVPMVGKRISMLSWKVAPFIFKIHVVMAYVFFVDLVISGLFVLPVRIIFN